MTPIQGHATALYKTHKHGSACIAFKWMPEEKISSASLQHWNDPRKLIYWMVMINSSVS
jgi:hypothetical protein